MINVTDKYINLTTTESGAEIRYTLDGTDPSLSSPLYSGTLSLGSDQVLKARTFKSGSPASNITRYFAEDTFSYRVLGSIPKVANYIIREMGQGEYIACSDLSTTSFLTASPGNVYVSKNLTNWVESPNLGAKRIYAAFKLKDNLGYAIVSSSGTSTSGDNDAVVEIYPDIFTNASPTFSTTLKWTYGGRVLSKNYLTTNKGLFFQAENTHSSSDYYYALDLIKIDDTGNVTKIGFGGSSESNYYGYGIGYNPISNEFLVAGDMAYTSTVGPKSNYKISKDFGISFGNSQMFNNSSTTYFHATSDIYGNIYLFNSNRAELLVNSKKTTLNSVSAGSSATECFSSSPYIIWSSKNSTQPFFNAQNIFSSTNSSSIYLKYNTSVAIGCCPNENTILCTQMNETSTQTDIIEVHIGPTSIASVNVLSKTRTMTLQEEPKWIPCKITYNTN